LRLNECDVEFIEQIGAMAVYRIEWMATRDNRQIGPETGGERMKGSE